MNRVIEIDYPAPLGNEQFGYDQYGRLLWKKDGNGAITVNEYDFRGRLIDVYYNYTGSLPTLPVYQHFYDSLVQGTNYGDGVTYDYTIDGYDSASTSRTSMTHSSGTSSYQYDDGAGNRSNVQLANGTSTAYAYDMTDPRYGLNTITHYSGSTTLATIDYTSIPRDYAGNPKSMTDWTGIWNYTYDANNRLAGATPPSPVPGQPAGGGYGYDWVGNRLNPPYGSNSMQYNAADQLGSWPGMHGPLQLRVTPMTAAGTLHQFQMVAEAIPTHLQVFWIPPATAAELSATPGTLTATELE